MRYLLIVSLLCIFATSSSDAQRLIERDSQGANSAAYYHYARSGDVTNFVHVWGAVAYPGLYEVPAQTRLNSVLSLAGGPMFEERSRRSKRTVRVRLIRDQSGTQRVVYEGEMTNRMVVAAPDPILMEGDTVVVEAELRERLSFRDLFSVVAAVASVVVAVDQLSTGN